MIARGQAVALGLAGAFAVAVPLLLLGSVPDAVPVAAPPPPPPLAVADRPALSAAYDRMLFAAGTAATATMTADAASLGPGPVPEGAPPPADAPELVGIAGRIDVDAVALVRTADGKTRTLAVGDSVDGWRLAALAIDAAYFTRGAGRVRVPLPTAP